MARLKQLNLQYHPGEDRVCLRVSTSDQQEFRFWLTRRYTRILWSVLMKLLQAEEHVRSQPEPEHRKQVISFQHEHAIQKADFRTTFESDAASFPLGEEPMLLSKIQAKQPPCASPVLCLHNQKSKGVELVLSDQLLHSVCKLIADTAKKAEWNLGLTVVQEASALARTDERHLN